ncbi:MAG: phosphoribosylaminoimidazolesuccinocarboxamide synthase [Actinomycetota bacterium]
MTDQALTNFDLPLRRIASGKVREIFDLEDGRLLFVASDRISAYDVVMRQGIPDKGAVLTGMTVFWLDLLEDIAPNHLLRGADAALPPDVAATPGLASRALVVRRLDMLPVEFVVRGYLVGSGWKDYRRTGSVSGVPLPAGLKEASRLPEPIFTPSTKATVGHDENISEEEAAELADPQLLKIAREYAVECYKAATAYAEGRGIILADTKFEFGVNGAGEVVLADEVLTPDSSRFWPAVSWAPGSSPPSYDKQYVRDWLDDQGWDHSPPPPDLPGDVVARTRAKYVEAYEQLTGRPFDPGAGWA